MDVRAKGLLALQRLARDSSEQTRKLSDLAARKREERRQPKQEVTPEPSPVEPEPAEQAPVVQESAEWASLKDKADRPPKEKAVNSVTIHGWFREQLVKRHGSGYPRSSWAAKQRTLAMGILKQYGEKMTYDLIVHMFDRWDDLCAQSRGKLTGVPTIELLWGMRERLVGEIMTKGTAAPVGQVRRVALQQGEYRKPEDDGPKTGW